MNFELINTTFLKKFNPQRVTFFGILLWLFFFFSASMQIKEPASFVSILYIFINYIALFTGFLLMRKTPVTINKKFIPKKETVLLLLYIFITVAILGFVFRLIDKLVIRQIVIGDTTIENRKLLVAIKPSIFGVLSAMMTPFSYIPFFLFHFLKLKSKFFGLICLVVFFLPVFDNLIMGSRSGIFIVIIFFAIIVSYFQLIKFTLSKTLIIGIFLFIGLLVTTRFFVERTKEYMVTDERAIKHILTNAVYNFTLEPTEKARDNIINTEIKTLKMAKLTHMNVAQYYCHGIFEFAYLQKKYENPHYYGAFTFGIIFKFTNIILGTNIDLNKIQNSAPRTGIYTTFFGPTYIDFGWLAPFFMFFFGILQSIVYNKILKGNFKYIPLLFYFLIIDFFIPVINFIDSAQGLYTIFSLLLFIFLFKLASSKIIFQVNNERKQIRFFK